MSEQTHIQTLFAYHFATTEQLIAGVAQLAPAERGPLQDILVHLLAVDYAWRITLESSQQPARLAAEDYPTLDALRAGFAAEGAAWAALIAGLDDAAIDGAILATRRTGEQMPLDRWRICFQVLMHGMQHHAELAQLLTEAGHSPGNIDFIFYR